MEGHRSRVWEREAAGVPGRGGITRPVLPRLSSSDSYLRFPLEWPCREAEME